MAGGDFGGAKVEGEFATVGEMAVGGTPCIGQGDRAQTPKAKEVCDVGHGTREEEDRREVAARGAR